MTVSGLRRHFRKICNDDETAPSENMLDPTPELPDLTPIERVLFSTRVRNALHAAGIKSIDDVRLASDATLLSLPDLGPGSIAFLRAKLGPSHLGSAVF